MDIMIKAITKRRLREKCDFRIFRVFFAFTRKSRFFGKITFLHKKCFWNENQCFSCFFVGFIKILLL